MSFILSSRKQSSVEKALYERECPLFIHIFDDPYTPSEQVWTYYEDFFKLMDAMVYQDELKDGELRNKRNSTNLKKFVVKCTNNLHNSVCIVYVNLNGKYVVVLRENGLANKYKEDYSSGGSSRNKVDPTTYHQFIKVYDDSTYTKYEKKKAKDDAEKKKKWNINDYPIPILPKVFKREEVYQTPI